MRPEHEMSNDAAMLRAQHLERRVEELGYVLLNNSLPQQPTLLPSILYFITIFYSIRAIDLIRKQKRGEKSQTQTKRVVRRGFQFSKRDTELHQS